MRRAARAPPATVGGVEVHGPNVFAGYWRMPEKTREEFTADGYFRTGDMGELLPNGYLRIVGRAKDLIITGGLNVYPKEIEEKIDALPGVVESAVIGVPDADFGEAVAAVVVAAARPRADGDRRDRCAAETRSRASRFRSACSSSRELPRNAMGKVQKNVLRERFAKLPRPRREPQPPSCAGASRRPRRRLSASTSM